MKSFDFMKIKEMEKVIDSHQQLEHQRIAFGWLYNDQVAEKFLFIYNNLYDISKIVELSKEKYLPDKPGLTEKLLKKNKFFDFAYGSDTRRFAYFYMCFNFKGINGNYIDVYFCSEKILTFEVTYTNGNLPFNFKNYKYVDLTYQWVEVFQQIYYDIETQIEEYTNKLQAKINQLKTLEEHNNE